MPSLAWNKSWRNVPISSFLHRRLRSRCTSDTFPSKPIMFRIISDLLNLMQSMNAFIPSHSSKNISQFSGVSSLTSNKLLNIIYLQRNIISPHTIPVIFHRKLQVTSRMSSGSLNLVLVRIKFMATFILELDLLKPLTVFLTANRKKNSINI